MDAYTLMAFPDVVIVDRKAGKKYGPTSILYTGDSAYPQYPPNIWERIFGDP